jgi:diadenylate cyclase
MNPEGEEGPPGRSVRSDKDFAKSIGQVARAVEADAVICGTATTDFIELVQDPIRDVRLVAATPNVKTFEALVRQGVEAIRLPIRVSDKYRQSRHMVSVALQAGKVSPDDLVVVAVGHVLVEGRGDLILVTDVEEAAADIALHEMMKLTDGIRPKVLQAALEVARRIGQVSRRGKRIGALFVLGDSDRVLEGSKQLIPNPFHGHEDADRMVSNPKVGNTLIELAKLDGATVFRGDGFIRTAGVFLAASESQVEVQRGLGTRHVTGAAVSARTEATAIVVSSTDGHVRAFAGGKLVLQLDPEATLAPL